MLAFEGRFPVKPCRGRLEVIVGMEIVVDDETQL